MNTNDFGKRARTYALLCVGALAFYHVVLFSIAGFSGHGTAFWISYAFMVLGTVTVAFNCFRLEQSAIQPRDRVLGFPILKHCAVYLATELAVSVLFMLRGAFCPNGIVLSVQLTLLVLHIVLVATCFQAKKTITELQDRTKRNTQMMLLLRADAEMLAEKTQDADAKKRAAALAEQLRYSDPVSNEALAVLEAQIGQTIAMATAYAEQGSAQEVVRCCEKAALLLQERNKKCALLK